MYLRTPRRPFTAHDDSLAVSDFFLARLHAPFVAFEVSPTVITGGPKLDLSRLWNLA